MGKAIDDTSRIGDGRIAPDLVRGALMDLTGQQRALLVLICVDGMSYRETAKLLDISLGSVAGRVARARAALDEQIGLRSCRPTGAATRLFAPARAGTDGGELS